MENVRKLNAATCKNNFDSADWLSTESQVVFTTNSYDPSYKLSKYIIDYFN